MKVHEVHAGIVTIDFFAEDALLTAEAIDYALETFVCGHGEEPCTCEVRRSLLEALGSMLEVAGTLAHSQCTAHNGPVPSIRRAVPKAMELATAD